MISLTSHVPEMRSDGVSTIRLDSMRLWGSLGQFESRLWIDCVCAISGSSDLAAVSAVAEGLLDWIAFNLIANIAAEATSSLGHCCGMIMGSGLGGVVVEMRSLEVL